MSSLLDKVFGCTGCVRVLFFASKYDADCVPLLPFRANSWLALGLRCEASMTMTSTIA